MDLPPPPCEASSGDDEPTAPAPGPSQVVNRGAGHRAPPPPPLSDEDDDDLPPASKAVKPTSVEPDVFTLMKLSNARVLDSGTKSYLDSFICVATGLHFAAFTTELSAAEALRRLQQLACGHMARTHQQAWPWKGMRTKSLPGALRVWEALVRAPSGSLTIAHAMRVFYDHEPPERDVSMLKLMVLRIVGNGAPVMLVSLGAPDASLGQRLEHGERLLMLRPTDLQPVLALYSSVLGYHEEAINRELAKLAGLPLRELLSLAGSGNGGAAAQKLVLAAVTHLAGKAALKRLHHVSLERSGRAVADVNGAIGAMAPLLDEAAEALSVERAVFVQKATAAGKKLERARRLGMADGALQQLEAEERSALRKAAIRDPESVDFPALLKRRWRAAVAADLTLQHLPRGHRQAVHVAYPHFKEAAEAAVFELGGGVSKDRQATTIHMGKSTWAGVAAKLRDAAFMASIGAPIPASVSCLKRHKARPSRSLQPKCTDEAGQLNIAPRKVAKLMLPTAVEQPNGWMLNFLVKELENFGMLNAEMFATTNRDDKAHWQLDNLYRKKRILQEMLQAKAANCGFYDSEGNFDERSYDRTMKADCHDHVTATGYRIIPSTHAFMDLGAAARRRSSAHADVEPLDFDPTHQSSRDAKLFVAVHNLKLQPSTPFEHARTQLYQIESHRPWHVMPFTDKLKPGKILIVDGGGDENPRFAAQILCNAIVCLRGGYEMYIIATAAAGFTPLRLVELGQCYLSQALDGVYIASDTHGTPRLDGKTGVPKTDADTDLERRNLQHANAEMVRELHGEEAFGFPIHAVTLPEPGTYSPFCEIDEAQMKDYLKRNGGCGCTTGCTTLCRSCKHKGRPCTWRCRCKGACGNTTPLPKPEKLSDGELLTLPLDQIVMRLTPQDVEFWASKHGRMQHYATQFRLCAPGAAAASCWYCSRFDEAEGRRLPAELHGRFWPFGTAPNAAGTDWKRLPERWGDVVQCKPCADDYACDATLPSKVLAAEYTKAPTADPSLAVLARLASRTLLQVSDIEGVFAKLDRKRRNTLQWEAPHRSGAAADVDDEEGECEIETRELVYDETLVGRRCTVLWQPRGCNTPPTDNDYYPATVVSYNPRARSLRAASGSDGPCQYIIHTDDGMRERVGLKDEPSIKIMTRTVNVCMCVGVRGCEHGNGGCTPLPVPWENTVR